MTAAKNQIYYTYLPKLAEDDQGESEAIIHTKGNNANLERDDSIHSDDKSDTIIMDADGNYYYQLSENIVKVEPLTKATEIPTKKVAADDLPSSKRNNTAQPSTKDVKRPKVEFSPNIKRKSEQKAKITDETISSEFSTQEEVYEFDKYEQNSVDPVKISDPNYESEGVIKKAAGNEVANFTCMICSYQTYKKSLLSRHLKTHSDERPYKCCVCERGFKTNAALSNHRNTHLGYKPHGCSSCDMAFTTSGELVRHERYRHTHIKPHKCTECDYSSVEMSKLRRHMRCHTGERPYQCPHCTYASPDTFKLKRHMRIHTGEKPYECDICHARFTQSNSLKHHRLIHSVNEKPVFQCHLCPTTCGRKTDLRLHIKKLHSSDQPIPCKRCGKELPDRYSYKMHIKTHEGEKCYRCEYCPYASISKRHLESHVFIHLNAKPFVCEVCESSFRQKPLLTRHIKIYHSSNYEPPQPRKKDHKCPHCGKMFAFNGNLMRHMEVHDPTSRMFEEKKTLKMGRMKRVRPDGSVVTITPSNNLSKLFDGSEEIFYEETEEHQAEDEGEFQKEYEANEAYNEHNIQYVYDDYEADEYEEQDEEQSEQLQDKSKDSKNLINVKEEQIEAIDIAQATPRNSLNIKAEGNNDSEIMSLELQDDQGFMVIEVLPDDDEEQQQEQEEVQQLRIQTVKHTIINKKAIKPNIKKSQNNSQLLISDYFGFEVNAEDEEDEETKGAIKLLEMIEQE